MTIKRYRTTPSMRRMKWLCLILLGMASAVFGIMVISPISQLLFYLFIAFVGPFSIQNLEDGDPPSRNRHTLN